MNVINSEKNSPIYETGVIHGRFQVFHNDHLKYLLAGKKLCRHLVVGITNPDPFTIRDENADLKRSSPLANPLTYFERYIIIRTVLLENGIKPTNLSVVPLPINHPDRYRYYVPMDAVFFLAIYDDWGRTKYEYFKSQGLSIHVLREVSPEEKGISAGDIRNKMINDQPWEHLVPQSVAVLMKKWGISARLKKLNQTSSNSDTK
jgi:nicotinamide-nucleotide adenylyltransferase